MEQTTTPYPLEIYSKEETLKLRDDYIGRSCTLFFRNNPLKIVRGEGQYFYDEQGHRYLDCINNVAHVGHCHPHVVKAGALQASLLSTNSRYLHDNIVHYAKRLISYFPNKLSVCYFVNSGSEANDLALQLAQRHTGNEDMICLEDAYHGHLSSIIAMSPYKFRKINGYRQKEWVHVAELPCTYRGKYTQDDYPNEDVCKLYIKDFKNMIQNIHNKGRRIAGFLAESMVSCGGQVVLPPNYLREVYKLVREAGGVTIADEVQTGFGRVGTHMWAFQTQGDDICPDIVTIGKPIGNGHPVSVVITTPEIAGSFEGRGVGYFNTFGGNPVSLAIANAVLDVIEDEDLVKKSVEIGNYLLSAFNELKSRHTLIGDVRGTGMFLGIDLVKCPFTKQPATEEANEAIYRLKESGILMSTDGRYENVLKFKPPMVFNMDNAKELVTVLDTVFTNIEESRSRSVSSTESSSIDGSSSPEPF